MIDVKKSGENYKAETIEVNKNDRIKRPAWLDQYNDTLAYLFYRQDEILKNGIVVPASLVLANDKLYHRKGLFYFKDHPAYFIYSFDDYYTEDPTRLEELASRLLEISKSGDKRIKEEKRIVSLFEGGLNRPIRKKLPETFTENREVFFTTTLVSRKHLPGGKLTYKTYPLLTINDDKADSMILPCKYWKYKGEDNK